MNIFPIKDNLVVEPIGEKDVTVGGIHLPDDRRKGAIIEGIVMATGPKVVNVSKGQTVVFDKHSPTIREIKVGATSDGRRFLLMKECDLLAVYV